MRFRTLAATAMIVLGALATGLGAAQATITIPKVAITVPLKPALISGNFSFQATVLNQPPSWIVDFELIRGGSTVEQRLAATQTAPGSGVWVSASWDTKTWGNGIVKIRAVAGAPINNMPGVASRGAVSGLRSTHVGNPDMVLSGSGVGVQNSIMLVAGHYVPKKGTAAAYECNAPVASVADVANDCGPAVRPPQSYPGTSVTVRYPLQRTFTASGTTYNCGDSLTTCYMALVTTAGTNTVVQARGLKVLGT